jgi:hypothetical protein
VASCTASPNTSAERFDVELRRRLQLGGLGVFNHDVMLAEFVEEWWQVHADFDPAERVSPEDEIQRARADVAGRSEDAGPDEAAAA